MGISIWQLVIILAIVLVLFGAKRLKNVGSDLGNAIKGFKKAVKDEDSKKDDVDASLEKKENSDDVFDVTAEEKVAKKTTKEETK